MIAFLGPHYWLFLECFGVVISVHFKGLRVVNLFLKCCFVIR
jgi:hypothetical protein